MDSDGDFSVTRRLDGEAAVVAPAGEIDLSNVDAVRRELHAARTEARLVVLDLSAVTFMDSSGLRLLVELQRASDGDGFSLVVVRGRSSLRRLFELAGLEGRVRMVDELGQAVGGDDPGTA